MKRSLKIIVAFFIAVVIVGSVIVISLTSNSNLTVSPQTISSSSAGSSGLELTLETSSNNTTQGNNISISLSVTNPTFVQISLNAPNEWSNYVKDGFAIGPCSYLPYGIMIAEGNYSLNTMNDATSLMLYEPGVYFCPAIPAVSSFVFESHSSTVKLYYNGDSGSQLQGTSNFDTSMNISGYWTGSNSSNSVFHDFSPGIYTVFGADGWGQVSVLHFIVKE